jgi:hypothetical protein
MMPFISNQLFPWMHSCETQNSSINLPVDLVDDIEGFVSSMGERNERLVANSCMRCQEAKVTRSLYEPVPAEVIVRFVSRKAFSLAAEV